MRIAAITGPDAGHLFPTVALAAALAARGHDVTVVTAERWSDDVLAAGLGFRPMPGLAPRPEDHDLGWRMWGRGAAMAPALAETLREIDVDVVVCDTLAAGGGFAAELLGRPWVELIPHFLWEPSRVLPPVGLGALPSRNPVVRLNHRHLRRRQRRSFDDGRAQASAARAAVGLPPSGGPALRLVATLPALEPPRPDWPARTFVVGALPWEPASWPVSAPPPGDEPLVLVTDTTASDIEASVAARTLEALAPLPVRVLATSTRDLPSGPRTVVAPSRHQPLLDQVACVVGGGAGIVSKALLAGVPIVAVPLQGDQLEMSARIVRVGAGVRVPWERATADRLRHAVRTVLDHPRYRQAAVRVARDAAGLGPDRAAALVTDRIRRATDGQVSGTVAPTS